MIYALVGFWKETGDWKLAARSREIKGSRADWYLVLFGLGVGFGLTHHASLIFFGAGFWAVYFCRGPYHCTNTQTLATAAAGTPFWAATSALFGRPRQCGCAWRQLGVGNNQRLFEPCAGARFSRGFFLFHRTGHFVGTAQGDGQCDDLPVFSLAAAGDDARIGCAAALAMAVSTAVGRLFCRLHFHRCYLPRATNSRVHDAGLCDGRYLAWICSWDGYRQEPVVRMDHGLSLDFRSPHVCDGRLPGMAAFPSYDFLHNDTTARDYAQPLLIQAPPNSTILADWHWATPLWYLQEVEGQRPDITVQFIYPEGEEYAITWARRIEEEFDSGIDVIATISTITPTNHCLSPNRLAKRSYSDKNLALIYPPISPPLT